MKYRRDYNPVEVLYSEYHLSERGRNDALSRNVSKYRTKTVKSGRICEVDIYPIWNRGIKTAPDGGKTSEIQRKVNQRNTRRKISRLLNANFCDGAGLWLTLTYDNAPSDFSETNKNLVNYFRRLKRFISCVNEKICFFRQYSFFEKEKVTVTHEQYLCALGEYSRGRNIKKNSSLICSYIAYGRAEFLEELKYVYVTEKSRSGRMHHHIVTNFPLRDIAESFWKLGKYNHSRRLVPDKDFGLDGLARYISKVYAYKTEFKKSYGYSQNLYRSWLPQHVHISDTKISSRRKASEIANDVNKAREWF